MQEVIIDSHGLGHETQHDFSSIPQLNQSNMLMEETERLESESASQLIASELIASEQVCAIYRKF